MKSTPSSSVRRTAAQWQAIVEQFEQSGMSAVRFCREQALGYASFCQWRRRLAADEATPVAESSRNPTFMDLSALASVRSGSGWNIVLNLGGGVELRLSRF